MADHSSIEWTEATWNPVTGCTRVSPGCDHCYIERTVPFRTQHRRFDKPGPGGTTGVDIHSQRLHQPLSWRTPRRVFVNSLADLFHEHVPDRFVADVFAVMTIAERHTFQVLTKRHGRMRSLLSSVRFWRDVSAARNVRGYPSLPSGLDFEPPPNVWLGVSVEDQKRAELRIPALLETPAAVRWLSCEPLLGPVELPDFVVAGATECPCEDGQDCLPNIDWVVAGGESGPGARPMHPDWARSLRDQCQAGGVPFFFKQWGGRTPKAAGRELDGRTWDEYPAVTADA